jgi:putative PIN family toxin of toxin-antitoxin system
MCDTNVLISGFLFPNSVPGKVIRHVAERERLVLATYIIEELRRVFQKKFSDKVENLERYIEREEFELFATPHDLHNVAVPSIRDVKDEPVLASAILADVDILITGNKDFTGVEIARPAILSPAAFLKLFDQV